MVLSDQLLYPREITFHSINGSSFSSTETCWMRIDSNSTNEFLRSTDPGLAVSSIVSTIAGTINILQCIFGICLNALVIWILLSRRSVRKEYLAPSLLSISITDFIFSAYNLPISASLYLNREHPLSSKGCGVYAIITFGTYFCSALNLFGISFLRTIAVYSSNMTKSTKFRYICILTPITGWIVALLLFLPSAIGRWGQFGLECKSLWCHWIPYDSDGSRVGTTYTPRTLAIPQLFVCGFAILGMNAATFLKIRNDARKIATGFKDTTIGMSEKMVQRERKAGEMVALITATFFLIYFPLNMLMMIEPFGLITHPSLALFFYVFTCNLCIIDPLLYIFWHRKFRKEIRRHLEGASVFPLANRLLNVLKTDDDSAMSSTHTTKQYATKLRTNMNSDHQNKV